jgi:peptidoglycan-associated lipoprotein
MGISAGRMETVSYGKVRPLVMGQTEEAFAANRRGHFVIK